LICRPVGRKSIDAAVVGLVVAKRDVRGSTAGGIAVGTDAGVAPTVAEVVVADPDVVGAA